MKILPLIEPVPNGVIREYHLPQCGACGLHKGCQSPKMPVDGKGHKRIMVVAEAPGREEDEQNVPLVGEAGQTLWDLFGECGVDRDDCWITNSLICRPPKNRPPHDKEILYCRPNLTQALKKYDPNVVVLLGGSAVKSMLRSVWKEKVGAIGRWEGWMIPCQKPNMWICPTYHPSYLNREQHKDVCPALKKMVLRHLKAAAKKSESRPWDEVPDYNSKIKLALDPDEAVDWIGKLTEAKRLVAFDFETNYAKPDSDEAKIICCSVSDGDVSAAFPWSAKAKRAMVDLLESDVPKVGQNIKFETRWAMAKLGVRVRKWRFDDMLAAHVLDSRSGITSIKFQAFVRLGMPSWDDAISPFLKQKGNKKNKIMEFVAQYGWEALLRYCAMDSLAEWHVAQVLAKKVGIHL